MSSHVHFAVLVQLMKIERVLQGVLGSVAIHINRVSGRVGHAFANRFKNIPVERENVGRLVAYIHNNEQRAGLVAGPERSRWSSHRAYIGLGPAPEWLAVTQGLALSGFDDTRDGRARFNDFVVARSNEPRQPDLSDPPSRKPPPFAGPWDGEPDRFMVLAGRQLGLEPGAIRSPNRHRWATEARGAILLAWCDGIGRRAVEVLPHVNMSVSAASRALARARSDAGAKALATTIVVGLARGV